MGTDEMLNDLTERLAEANMRLLDMAQNAEDATLSTDFVGNKFSSHADRLRAKAEGVRLALSYVNELRRFA